MALGQNSKGGWREKALASIAFAVLYLAAAQALVVFVITPIVLIALKACGHEVK